MVGLWMGGGRGWWVYGWVVVVVVGGFMDG